MGEEDIINGHDIVISKDIFARIELYIKALETKVKSSYERGRVEGAIKQLEECIDDLDKDILNEDSPSITLEKWEKRLEELRGEKK